MMKKLILWQLTMLLFVVALIVMLLLRFAEDVHFPVWLWILPGLGLFGTLAGALFTIVRGLD